MKTFRQGIYQAKTTSNHISSYINIAKDFENI